MPSLAPVHLRGCAPMCTPWKMCTGTRSAPKRIRHIRHHLLYWNRHIRAGESAPRTASMVAICRISVGEEGGKGFGKTRLSHLDKTGVTKNYTLREKANDIDLKSIPFSSRKQGCLITINTTVLSIWRGVMKSTLPNHLMGPAQGF